MLKRLTINNFAIIEAVTLHFKEGMTTLTGETGAGKSIIIDAVGLIIGGRGSSDFVRHGAKKCVLEGEFNLPTSKGLKQLLDQLAIDADDDILNIQREIYASGRSVCRVNGSMVTIANLKAIGNYLIDIHGQNEHQELMDFKMHQQLLDRFGGDSLQKVLETYQNYYQKYKKIKKQLNHWQQAEKEAMQQLDIYEFQMKEIKQANLTVGEETTLKEEEQKLANFQTLKQELASSYYSLQNDTPSALEQLGSAMESMSRIAAFDKKYQAINEQLTDAFYTVQDLASEILEDQDNLEYDESRLHEIMSRLDVIQQLKRKYGDSIAEILDYYEDISTKYRQIKNQDRAQEELTAELHEVKQAVLKWGKALSEQRRKIAKQLERKIKGQLQDLYMEKSTFVVHFGQEVSDYDLTDASASGLDQIEFYVTTNPGEPLKPLVKVASGGELSRFMLAVKSIFSSAQGVTSIIFDEIDTGVSGRVAQAIANKMHALAQGSQVLAVSHLPQVAAISDHHLFVRKKLVEKGARTITEVKPLTPDERIQEIARMLSGEEITKASLEAAKELLK